MGEELGLTEPNSSDENTINEIEAAAEIYATARYVDCEANIHMLALFLHETMVSRCIPA